MVYIYWKVIFLMIHSYSSLFTLLKAAPRFTMENDIFWCACSSSASWWDSKWTRLAPEKYLKSPKDFGPADLQCLGPILDLRLCPLPACIPEHKEVWTQGKQWAKSTYFCPDKRHCFCGRQESLWLLHSRVETTLLQRQDMVFRKGGLFLAPVNPPAQWEPRGLDCWGDKLLLL